MAGFILQFHMYDLRRLLIKEMLYLRITRMITKLTTPTADILNSLYPMHFIIDDAGALESISATMALQFPEAQSMTYFLAPNSAEELILLIGKLRDEKNTSSKIDLFSIQQYAIWNSKIVRIEEQSSWLVCCEVELLQKNMKSAAEMSVEALNSIIQQNEFYTALLNHLPAEVAVFNPEFKFLFVNKSAIKNEELRKWLIGRSEIEYWKSKNLPLEKAINRIHAFKEAIEAQRMTSVEEIFHPGTEQEKHYIRVTNPYFENDELRFLLTYGVDITAIKKTEHQLIQQYSELEKVNAELDQLVYSASHNLRAPLLSMKGLLSLISLEDVSAADREKFMHEVFRSIERLDATIHDIIEYSKNARLEITPQTIDLPQLIANTTEDLRFYENHPVEIRTNYELKAPFHCDERRIKSILHNILSNSVKYADHSKSQSWISIDAEVTSAMCRLRFSDNGIGMESHTTERVFDMFYRGTSQRTGSGLGLYIVREIIQKLGGTIQLDAQQGVGVNIQIELPNIG
jgi:signal transduction histidine kinase